MSILAYIAPFVFVSVHSGNLAHFPRLREVVGLRTYAHLCALKLFCVTRADFNRTCLIFAQIFSNRLKQRQVRVSKKQQRHAQQHCAAALWALACSCFHSLSPLCSLTEKLCTLEARTFGTSRAETKADPTLFRSVSSPPCGCPSSFLLMTASVTERKW